MLKHVFLRISGALALLAAILATAGIPALTDAQSSGWINTADRAAVVAAYETEFGKTEPAIGWTGSVAGCNPGETSPEFRQASVDRVNFYRRLAGLPGSAVEDAELTRKAMEGALANSANQQLQHSIGSDQTCYSADANDAAAKSNIATTNGYAALELYMDDASSARTGHRIGILHPPLQNIGVGDVTGEAARNSLYWIDNAFADEPAMREADGFVAWPPRGFVPSQLIYTRWSFTLRGANFDAAEVAVTAAGAPVASEVVHRRSTSNGVPFSVITFDVPAAVGNPSTDTTYTVSIDGVSVGGINKSFTYDVTAIGGVAAPAPSQEEETIEETAGAIQPVLTELPDEMAAAASIEELKAAEGFDVVTDQPVLDQYATLFDRDPDLDGAKYWLRLLRNGHPLADLKEHMMDTPEYAPKAITEFYSTSLNRTPDAEGLAYWIRQVEAGATREDVRWAINQSEEFRALAGARSAILKAQAVAGG